MKGVFTFLFILTIQFCFAQQAQQYSLQMLNRYEFNPAFAGMDASLSINGAYRSQWESIPGNPIQQNINAHMPFYLFNGAVGIQFANESIGAEKNIRAALSYNYVYETPVGLFSAGIRAGIFQKSLDGTLLRALDGDYGDGQINHNDPNIPNGMVRGMTPTIDLGLYFAGNFFEVGIAANQFALGEIDLDGAAIVKPRTSYNLFFEYFIESFDQLDIYPTLFMKSDLNETQIELSVRGVYNDQITAGFGFRGYNQNSIDAVILLLGLKLSDHLDIAYAFDWTLSPLQTAVSGTHELVMRYNLNQIIGAGLPPRVIYNPRFYE